MESLLPVVPASLLSLGCLIVGTLFIVAVLLYLFRRRGWRGEDKENFRLESLKSASDASEDYILLVSRDYKVLYANRSAKMFYHFEESEILKNSSDVYRFYDKESKSWERLDELIHRHRRRKVDEQTVFQNLYLGLNMLGPVHMTIRSVGRGTAHHCDVIVIHNDSCEYRLMDQKFTNGLSGLPNRLKADKDITELIARYSQEREFALVAVELDEIYLLRSLVGYEEIERIISYIANALGEIVFDPKIHCYHLSYVTFLLVIEEPESDYSIYAVIQTFKELIKQRYSKSNRQYDLSFSFGVALYPAYKSFSDLVNASYRALAACREQGAGRIAFAGEEAGTETDHALLFNYEIGEGLEGRDFQLYFQPLVNAKDFSPVGAEVLIRWKDPDGGFRMPDTFIPVAENSGLIVEIGHYVLEESLKRLCYWYQAGFPPLLLNLNLSLRELEEPEFINRLAQLLQKYDIGSSQLKFEITEHAAMINPIMVREQMKKVHELGIGIALDDFGTGYSSFAYLAELPIDTLKIDRSFVTGILQDQSKQRIVASIAKLGHSLGMDIVAEGVERKEEARLLREYGLDILQGYYFSKPLPQLDFQYLLAHPELGV